MALCPEEREIISRELARDEKVSTRYLGRLLGRDHSGIAKEIARNGGRAAYRATAAQERCDTMRARPKARKLESSARLHDAVNDGLAQKWSPKQIAERLERDHPDDPELRVSHETIYECLYLQARGELRTQLKQRGANENTSGLLGQYFPKGTDLSLHTQEELNRAATELNGRPRETIWVEETS